MANGTGCQALPMVDALDHALGALYGLAIGDALGMPTQFLSRAAVLELYGPALAGFEPGPAPNPISAGMPAGSVTDDTQQAIILAQTLVDGGGTVDQWLLADRLLAWEADMVRQGSADLLGPSTRRALNALNEGIPLEEAGRWGDTNGAAMRITPVGVATPVEPLSSFCKAVARASMLTHGTGIAIAGACAVGAAVSAGLDGADDVGLLDVGIAAAERGAVLGQYMAGADVAVRIRWAVDLLRGQGGTRSDPLDQIDRLVGTGVATQESVPAAFALVAQHWENPWQACLVAASLGGDADTIAAMVGTMLGAMHGQRGFPPTAVKQVDDVNDLGFDDLAPALLTLRERR
jgi:ADP-ribosylglycohydrolase